MEQKRDRVGTIFLHSTSRACLTRAHLKNARKKNPSVLHAVFEKANHHYSQIKTKEPVTCARRLISK